MSLQVYQKPLELFHPAYSHHTLFTVGETQSSLYTQNNFKFIFEVYVIRANKQGATETEYHRFSIKPNADGLATFDAGQVIQDYSKTDIEIYAGAGGSSSYDGTTLSYTSYERQPIHLVDKYSKQYGNLVKVMVTVYERYTDANGNEQTGNYVTIGDHFAFWNAVMPQDVGRDIFTDIFYNYNGFNDKFLTDMPSTTRRKIRRTDFHTFAFFNGKFKTAGGTQSTLSLERIKVTFYDSSNSSLGAHVLLNTTANGGAEPSNADIEDSADITKMLLYAGVGPQNITNAGGTIPADTSYYTVQGTNTDGTSARSALYTFELEDDDCKGYETIRLAYLNRHGAWDYYNFTKKSVRKINTERGLLKKNDVYTNAIGFRDSFIGGTSVYKTRIVEVIEANTDYISEEEATALESLFTSPQVFLQDLTNPSMLTNGSDARFYPVVVREKTYTKQTTANDMLKQYVIEIEKSNNTPIQRL